MPAGEGWWEEEELKKGRPAEMGTKVKVLFFLVVALTRELAIAGQYYLKK